MSRFSGVLHLLTYDALPAEVRRPSCNGLFADGLNAVRRARAGLDASCTDQIHLPAFQTRAQ